MHVLLDFATGWRGLFLCVSDDLGWPEEKDCDRDWVFHRGQSCEASPGQVLNSYVLVVAFFISIIWYNICLTDLGYFKDLLFFLGKIV